MLARAANAYRRVDLESAPKTQILERLFDRFLADLATAREGIAVRDVKKKAAALDHAMQIVAELKASLDPKSFTIATFALCGFANFSSIGIQIGGIGALAPERRHDLARLGLRAMFAGTLANFMTATIAGFLL